MPATRDPTAEALIDHAVSLLQTGDAPGAEAMLRQVLARSPDNAEALALWGVVHQQQGRTELARVVLERSLELDPTAADPHYNLGEVLRAEGRQGYLEHYQACVTLDPQHLLAWRRIAHLHSQVGDDLGALNAFTAAARLEPDDPQLQFDVGKLQLNLGHFSEAMQSLWRSSRLDPDRLQPHLLLSQAAAKLNDADAALAASDRALELAPEDQQVRFNRVVLLTQFGRLAEAIDSARAYVLRFSDDPKGHRQLAAAFMAQCEYGAAARAVAAAIALQPEDAEGYVLLGEVLTKMGRCADAVVQLRRALNLNPDSAKARLFLSVALDRLHRRDEAIVEAFQCVERAPADTEVNAWLGHLLIRAGRHSEAGHWLEQVLARSPKHALALTGAALLAAGRGEFDQAWALYEQAIAANPDDPLAVGTALMTANANPNLSAQALFQLHREWARRVHPRRPAGRFHHWTNDPNPDRKLRVGYVSADLRAHSVAYFLQPLLAAHDRSQVELIAFDNTTSADSITTHLRTLFDEWHRIVGVGDLRVAELVRERRIDLLIDLNGHTADGRLELFAFHPAPLQVSYLGYPNTTGLPEMEYRLTDATADPPGESDALATEKLVRLPRGFLCFNPVPPYPDVSTLPAGDAGPITFAAFNAAHKINDAVMGLWSRVLRELPASQLLLKANGFDDASTRRSLTQTFSRYGVTADRVSFLPRASAYAEHLSTYHRCDLALDTFPYNGTTTTCEALWMGVPVLSLVGHRHAARVGASLMTQIGLSQLLAESPESYVRIAVALASDRPRLRGLRANLRARMQASPLMDGPAHARDVEQAFRTMWRHWCQTQVRSSSSS